MHIKIKIKNYNIILLLIAFDPFLIKLLTRQIAI